MGEKKIPRVLNNYNTNADIKQKNINKKTEEPGPRKNKQ